MSAWCNYSVCLYIVHIYILIYRYVILNSIKYACGCSICNMNNIDMEIHSPEFTMNDLFEMVPQVVEP